jgi:hypothetical protein
MNNEHKKIENLQHKEEPTQEEEKMLQAPFIQAFRV